MSAEKREIDSKSSWFWSVWTVKTENIHDVGHVPLTESNLPFFFKAGQKNKMKIRRRLPEKKKFSSSSWEKNLKQNIQPITIHQLLWDKLHGFNLWLFMSQFIVRSADL